MMPQRIFRIDPRAARFSLLGAAAALLACASSAEPPSGLTAGPAAPVPPPAVAPAPQPAATNAEPEPAQDFGEYRRRMELAAGAYTKKDFAGFLEHSLAAARAFPSSPRAVYNLACAFSINEKKEEAIAALDRLADLRVYFDIGADSDFNNVNKMPEFQALRARFEALKAPVTKSSVAFTIAQKDLIPEGVAHDPATGSFFVSSVHLRKIVKVGPSGKVVDFVKEGQHGFYAVLGIIADPPRGSLWACSTAVPEMKGYKKEEKGKAALVELELATGKLRRKITPAEPEKEHNFNDLTVDSKGEIFIADPMAAAIYRLPAGSSDLEVFVPAGSLASPGGLALSPDEKTLYVADYSRGIARVDRASREVVFLLPPAGATLAGTDGLRLDRGDLIGIQNGIRPHRVVRIALEPDGRSIRAVTTLEMAHQSYNEPTLGVVAARDFVYIANSQWGSFDREGVIWKADKLQEPVILKLPLD
ncbi:MAG: SMP-30/gluconolactonase/LRE family protein [Polyangiaceae bacterium]|nr:SMP-30/gluconolactonase/LRE family protein [Polyangiaceae bacterium]